MKRIRPDQRYGLSPALFDELLAAWQQLQKDFAVAAPFVPVVGTHYGEPGAPKIMYIGKATEGWGTRPASSLAEDRASTKDFYDRLSAGKYRSMYWFFIRDLTAKLFDVTGNVCTADHGNENPMKWALDRVIWSNLMKIGSVSSWPRKRLAKAQAPLMEKLLRYELETHRPDAIILTTNWYEWEFVEKVFGMKGREEIAEVGGWPILAIDADDICARLYWARHPQGWKDRWKAENEIAADFKTFFSHDR